MPANHEHLHLRAAIVAARVSNIARLLQGLARDTVAIIDMRPCKLHGFQAFTWEGSTVISLEKHQPQEAQ
jgi:hypothetical protein